MAILCLPQTLTHTMCELSTDYFTANEVRHYFVTLVVSRNLGVYLIVVKAWTHQLQTVTFMFLKKFNHKFDLVSRIPNWYRSRRIGQICYLNHKIKPLLRFFVFFYETWFCRRSYENSSTRFDTIFLWLLCKTVASFLLWHLFMCFCSETYAMNHLSIVFAAFGNQ